MVTSMMKFLKFLFVVLSSLYVYSVTILEGCFKHVFLCFGLPAPHQKKPQNSLILAINVSSILHHFPEGLYDHCAQANHGIA